MGKIRSLTLSLTVAAAAMATSTANAATEMRCSHQLPPGHHIAKVIDRWAAEVDPSMQRY